MRNLKKLYSYYTKYNKICNFIVIYVQEAHSTDQWSLTSNNKKGINIQQHQSIEDKINGCKEMIEIWKSEAEGIGEAINLGKFQIVCDDIDCNAEIKFNVYPERIYILNKDNTIALKGGYGPYDFRAEVIEEFFFDK